MTITDWFCQWYHKNYDLSKHNHIIKVMISTNINLGWPSLMKDCDCNYSNYFFASRVLSQETFANELCLGILAAKSEIKLDMRWDYLSATVRTTDNLQRVGWGQSQNPQLAIVSASLNWINIFRSLLFCHELLQPFPLSKISLAEMKIWLSQIIVRKLKLLSFI